MKVKCTRLLNAPKRQSSWLTAGKAYDVLSVVRDLHGRWLLRLMVDAEPGIGLFPLEQFEILSPSVPSCWIVTWNAAGVFELTTEDWSRLGFWESYFDSDPSAMAVFERDMRRIIQQNENTQSST
jgi:hypothetical protein